MPEYMVEQVRERYDRMVGDSQTPRYGSFNREMVKALLDRIEELEEDVDLLQTGKAFGTQKSRAHSEQMRKGKGWQKAKETPPGTESYSIEDVLPEKDKRRIDKARSEAQVEAAESSPHTPHVDASPQESSDEGEIGEENDRVRRGE